MTLCKQLFVQSFPLSFFISPVLRLPAFPLFPSPLAFAQCDYAKGLAIASVQAPIPQWGPCLLFRETPLVPYPFAFQPNHASVRCVAEQVLGFALGQDNLLSQCLSPPGHVGTGEFNAGDNSAMITKAIRVTGQGKTAILPGRSLFPSIFVLCSHLPQLFHICSYNILAYNLTP